ncbi:MAG: EamA family transporter, partial [Planctomycetes bacterium]|nr:EamA family transporter [Planctomycetota bacterium]
MDTDLKGEICALAAAITWATALVLFKRSGERVPPLPLNLFKNVTALILLVVTLAVMGEGMDELRKFAVSDMVI